MTSDDEDVARKRTGYVGFILSQLCDDLDDLVAGLESGAITDATAVAGARVQLQWGLNELPSLVRSVRVTSLPPAYRIRRSVTALPRSQPSTMATAGFT
jgi:hypothetical protein